MKQDTALRVIIIQVIQKHRAKKQKFQHPETNQRQTSNKKAWTIDNKLAMKQFLTGFGRFS